MLYFGTAGQIDLDSFTLATVQHLLTLQISFNLRKNTSQNLSAQILKMKYLNQKRLLINLFYPLWVKFLGALQKTGPFSSMSHCELNA